MLMPDQVLSFLMHEKAFVRAQAGYYFRHASCLGLLTADHYWQVIDRFGPDNARQFLAYLAEVPQTEASYARAMKMLADGARTPVRD